jgi:very-short-patch-repair endonuclease
MSMLCWLHRRMGGQVRTVEAGLARLAARAHGVVTRGELLAAGVTRDQIDGRVRKGALIVVHRGVYRVGHGAPSLEARYLAAVKACGSGAVLSGRAAAHLLGLLGGRTPDPEVTTRGERRVAGVATRRCRRLHPTETTLWRGIPATTPARTLVDLAAALGEAELARVCHQAGVRHYTTPNQVEAVLSRRPNALGAAKLRAVLRGDVTVTLSKLEAVFLKRLRSAGLPLPDTNRPAGGRRVDCRWPQLKLTVELDSYRYHNSRHAWEQDRRREREAHARGDQLRRYTYNDVLENPRPMLAELSELLSRAASPPGPTGADASSAPRSSTSV